MGHRKISLLGRQETYIEIEKQDRGRNAWNSTGSWADSKKLSTEYCTEGMEMLQNGDVSIWSCVYMIYHWNILINQLFIRQ